ncbi:hypothetical protein ACIGXF_16395 [Streptomyces sp. NPDC053086]|uniref:hypothetical protein n=1 Tax=unclassified Streptomyces TaxID=2593676 RepID=UPI0037D10550
MSTTPPPPGPRPAAVVQAEIRALWTHRDKRLSDEERARYEALVKEYAAAVRGGVTTAA